MATWSCNLCTTDEARFRVPADPIGVELMKAHLEDVHGVDYIVPPPVTYRRPGEREEPNR